MAAQPQQRSRRPQVHQQNQSSVPNLQSREDSQSPSFRERPRSMKTQSMSAVPQLYGGNNVAQQASQGQQGSPTIPSNLRRSPPAGVQITRLLPTPPHPNPPNLHEPISERHMSSTPPPLQHAHTQPVNTHYPRPINRVPPAQFLTKYQNMEDSWQMTDELLADIERAADQQQSQSQSLPLHTYPSGYPRGESPSPPKDPNVERIRTTERSSPKELDSGQQQRRQRELQPAARESPKVRDRQPISPVTAAFMQAQVHTPERRMSPMHHPPLGSPGEHPQNYGQYPPRDSPPVHRRQANAINTDRSQLSLSSQTPPLQAISARTPDRSLPVQEEAEDELGIASKDAGAGARDSWKSNEQQPRHMEHQRRSSSPTPPSDLNSEGIQQRYEPNHVHASRDGRDDDKHHHEQNEATDRRYLDVEHTEEEGGYTPRSPTASLPDTPPDKYLPSQTTGPRGTIRARGRNGSTDQLGMRGLDPSVFEQPPLTTAVPQTGPRVEHSPNHVDPRRASQDNHQQYQQDNERYNDPRMGNGNGRYVPPPPQSVSDDYPSYQDDTASLYLQAYMQSPRPDAPIPPTPHSQSAAPSPSPLLSGGYDMRGKDMPPFSPVIPAGSPYPYPFSHVRRTQPVLQRPQFPSNSEANHPSLIQEQIARQWQIYAQNNHGNISDSTFSPSSTPFQGADYNSWAFLHMNRTLGRLHDTRSLQSSPSHEPVALPPPPPLGLKKKDMHYNQRRHSSSRKPPPRVESTQPRETSPEPSSSGEETAGEEHFAARTEGSWMNGTAPVVTEDDSADWIDEDDDEDDEDLLELEYHPTFVSNVAKRKRRWEIGWEALVQAFHALDRQTDATMVLMAGPSHSTKLHSIKSRSIRRQSAANSSGITEMRGSFKRVAAHRRSTRSIKSSLIDRFLTTSSSSGDGSDGSSESREEDLKRALEAALGSLGALGGIYEQRESRWAEEMRRISEDRERVELLLRQVLGESHLQRHGPELGL